MSLNTEMAQFLNTCCQRADLLHSTMVRCESLTSETKETFLEKIQQAQKLLKQAQEPVGQLQDKDVEKLFNDFSSKIDGCVARYTHLMKASKQLPKFPSVPTSAPEFSPEQKAASQQLKNAQKELAKTEDELVKKHSALAVAERQRKEYNQCAVDLCAAINDREETLKTQIWTYGVFKGSSFFGGYVYKVNEEIIDCKGKLSEVLKLLQQIDQDIENQEAAIKACESRYGKLALDYNELYQKSDQIVQALFAPKSKDELIKQLTSMSPSPL